MRRLPILLAVLALASPAFAFRSQSSLWVEADSPTDFTVKYRSDARQTQYWCAAGDFVIRELGLPGSTKVFRLTPPPRKAGQGIRFTLDQARGSESSGHNSIRGAREGGISAAAARATYCSAFDFP